MAVISITGKGDVVRKKRRSALCRL